MTKWVIKNWKTFEYVESFQGTFQEVCDYMEKNYPKSGYCITSAPLFMEYKKSN